MYLKENKNNENLPMRENEFLRPIAVKFALKEGLKNLEKDKKQKFLEDYRHSLFGLNKQFDLDFMVEECIGSGSTGAIFKGLSSKQKGKRFALKFIMEKKSSKNIESHHKKAKNEIKLQYNLKSPHITEVFGYYTLNNDYCIVQDYEKLGDLNAFQKKVLNGAFFNENLKLIIANNMLKALKHLKEMSISHFDLKKENILVDEFFNFKLSDFSVSESYFGNKYITLKNVGTGCYISPENYKKQQVFTNELVKVDLWSLGVLLYKLSNKECFPFGITGKEQDLEEIHLKIENNCLNLDNLDASSELKDLIFQLLKKNIKERAGYWEVVNHPWMLKSEEIIELKKKYSDNYKFIKDLIENKLC